jgi:hypothetical protein
MHSQIHDAYAEPMTALADDTLVMVREALDPEVVAEASPPGNRCRSKRHSHSPPEE